MRFLLCIDDTDDLTKKTSTGKIVQHTASDLKRAGASLDTGIIRHQLLLDKKVAYTSHNSSMCFEADCATLTKEQIIDIARRRIRSEMSEVSDPGLAICWLDELESPLPLIEFGFKAKQTYITKEEAFDLAGHTASVFLEELGGDGIGVIGALAGIGLSLSKCDGTLRGKRGEEISGQTMKVSQMVEYLGVDCLLDENNNPLQPLDDCVIDSMAKLGYWDGKFVGWAQRKSSADGTFVYHISSNHEDIEKFNWAFGHDCKSFSWDNDSDEMSLDEHKGCVNCLYRRWESQGFSCVKQ